MVNRNRNSIAIVIPTLGTRIDYLNDAIESIQLASSNHVHICVVTPDPDALRDLLKPGVVSQFVRDSRLGLAHAINEAVLQLPENITKFNWLGDDDLLTPGSIDLAADSLDRSDAPYVFGGCNYIDEIGHLLFVNKSGRWAIWLMRFGPQLIPQPGALFRRKDFAVAGGLDTQFKLAFDLDVFIRLSRVARPIFIPQTLASFRWHNESLTVGTRRQSVAEASRIRKMNLHPFVRRVSFLWEPFVTQLILRVGQKIKTRKNGL
jgi:GT2 family glycosyltransferase